MSDRETFLRQAISEIESFDAHGLVTGIEKEILQSARAELADIEKTNCYGCATQRHSCEHDTTRVEDAAGAAQ
jgi:hypothetical protein